MAEDLYVEQNNFAGGVQPATSQDRLPDDALLTGINSAFREVSEDRALIGTRQGLTVVNTTAVSGGAEPHLDFMRLYAYDAGPAFTTYLALLTRNGNLYYKQPDNTLTSELTLPAAWSATSGTACFSPGDVTVDGTVFNNRLFLIKGSTAPELRSFLGTTAVPWGLSPITTISISATGSGVNSMPVGTYDVGLTSYNSLTGAESSLSPITTVTLTANQRISVSITPTAAESAKYTGWRIYLRQQSTQSRLYLVATLGTGGTLPITTTSAFVDLSQATLSGFTTQAPSSTENNVPAASIKYVATYGRRLLVADERTIYWSKQDKADNFPPLNSEPIETGEGDRITGLFPFSEELLLVLTTTAIWGIYGNDPQTWTFKPIDHTIGCVSHLSLVEFDGGVGWWSDAYGPVIFDGTRINRIAERDLGRAVYIDNLNNARANHIYAGHDPQFSRVVWAYPEAGQQRNTALLPYNYRIGRFEATKWNPMPAASLALGYVDNGSPRLFLGTDRGILFYFDAAAQNDGVPSGTVSGTFTTTNQFTLTQIVDVNATFYTTGSGLLGRYVLITDTNLVPMAKLEIFNSGNPNQSNGTNFLQLGSTLTVQPGRTYQYFIAGPDFRVSTRSYDMGQTFLRKRFDRIYFHAKSQRGADVFFISTQVNFLDAATALPANLILGGAQWDGTGVWDVSQWAGDLTLKKRLAFFRSAQSVQINLFHYYPNQDITFGAIGLLARPLTDRYYG